MEKWNQVRNNLSYVQDNRDRMSQNLLEK